MGTAQNLRAGASLCDCGRQSKAAGQKLIGAPWVHQTCPAYRCSARCCFLQIGTFMTDIADEFKIVVVEAIRSLCLKFPQKYRALMNFLSGVLREDGGFEYKKAIVDSILILIREIPDAKESGLAHLCEFIEVSINQATWSHAVHVSTLSMRCNVIQSHFKLMNACKQLVGSVKAV